MKLDEFLSNYKTDFDCGVIRGMIKFSRGCEPYDDLYESATSEDGLKLQWSHLLTRTFLALKVPFLLLQVGLNPILDYRKGQRAATSNHY